MIIGDRLRALREQKNLSQGNIQKHTGFRGREKHR
jgi:cytoskeletal protein RodZ